MPDLKPDNSYTGFDSKTPVVGVGTLNISLRAKNLVLDTLNRNRLSYGPLTEKFERSFSQIHGCRFGIMSNSGTSALQLALQAMKELHGWQDGDEVLVPSVTFVATANIVLHNRMRPVLVDVDPLYYEIDPKRIEAKISARTRAVIPVHLFGHPADMDPLREIAARRGLKIIENSCETMFVSYGGQRVGSLGDIGCFSTYVAHLLVTGVGGVNVTNNPEYAIRIRSLMNHGRDSIYLSIDDDNDKTKEELRLIVARRFKFISAGHSFRVTEMEAALGLAQLEDWETMIARRRSNAQFLTRSLSGFGDRLQLPSIRPNSEHAFMMYPIVLRQEGKQDLVQYLEEHSVETRDMLPLTSQPVYQGLWDVRDSEYPVADWINRNGFYIGCHQDLRPMDLEYVVELFERFWRGKRIKMAQGAALVLRTHNSERYLPQVLDALPFELFAKTVVYDAGSTDRTLDILKDRGYETVPLGGEGLLDFVASRTDIEQENVVLYPVDGRHDVRDVAGLLLLLERNNDMVIASRFLPGGERRHIGRPGQIRSTGNRVFNLLANLLFYANLTDSLSQFRAVKRSKLKDMAGLGRGLSACLRLSIRAAKSGWRIAELPTVEFFNPALESPRRILLSLPPLLKVLLGEWLAGNKARPAKPGS